MSCFINPILPLVYENSLSYMEQLAKLTCKVNEITEFYNNIGSIISEEVQKQLQIYVDEVNRDLDEFRKEFDEYKVSTDLFISNKFIDINNQLDNWYNELTEWNLNFKKQIDGEISEIYKKHNTDIESVRAEISRVETELLIKIEEVRYTLPDIINPVTGLKDSIENTIADVYFFARTGAITCSEYDLLELTATVYDSKNIGAFDFDTNGKSLLM